MSTSSRLLRLPVHLSQFSNRGMWPTCPLMQFTPADAHKRMLRCPVGDHRTVASHHLPYTTVLITRQ